MSEQPLVSVLMPSHNHEAFVAEAIESVLVQTYPHVELIVCDDASTDGTRRIIQAYAARYPEKIRATQHQQNKGVSQTWNDCLAASRGTFIAPLASDDRFPAAAVEERVRFLTSHPDVDVIATDFTLLTGSGAILDGVEKLKVVPQFAKAYQADWANLYEELLRGNFVPGNTVMIRLSRIAREQITMDPLCPNLSDYDLWLRLAQVHTWRFLPIPTCIYRWHGKNYSSPTNQCNSQPVVLRQSIYILSKQLNSHPSEPHRSLMQKLIMLLSLHLVKTETSEVTTDQLCSATLLQPNESKSTAQQYPFTVSIIIPVWNKRELTEQCLAELARVTSGISYEVIVVDNHSTDDTPDFLNRLSGDIQIIRNSENLGFAKACNQGARAARGRFLVFLNNDTIPLNDWLTTLVAEVTSHPDVGIVGSKLLYENDTIQHAGVVFSRDGLMPYHAYRRLHRDHPAVNQRRTFQSVTAACMLIRREVFETVGGFDEGFQNGLEDVDLCLKVGDKGLQIVYQPLSVLYHLESQTPGRKTHEQANALRFLKRWGQRWWLADEDLYYCADGYMSVHTKDGDKEQLELRPLQQDGEKASWRLVVETERAALRQDISLMESLLVRWDEWPSVADVLSWGAWLCTKIGHSPLSRHFYEKLLQHHDDPAARRALARMALEEGNLTEADAHLSALMTGFPQDGEGWVLRGILDMQRTQYAEAEQAFLTALTHQGDRRKSMMGLGMARVGLNESAQAWNDFCTLLNEYPDDAEAIHWLLRAGAMLGLWAELSWRLQGFVSRNPADLSARYALAGVLIRSGRIDVAQQEYQTICTLAPSYEGLKELAQALSTHDTLAEIVPQS